MKNVKAEAKRNNEGAQVLTKNENTMEKEGYFFGLECKCLKYEDNHE
jgi:hypothetical protein